LCQSYGSCPLSGCNDKSIRNDACVLHQSKSVSLLKATHPLGIIILVSAACYASHSWVLATWISHSNVSTTEKGLALLLRVLKSRTLLLQLLWRLRLLLHQWDKLSDLVCRDEDDRYKIETSRWTVTSSSHHSEIGQRHTECKSEALVIFQQKHLSAITIHCVSKYKTATAFCT